MATRRYDPRVQDSSTYVEENGKEDSGSVREDTSEPDGLVERQQRGSSRNVSAASDCSSSAKLVWSKEKNIVAMECYYLSRPLDEEGKPVRGYRRRMFNLWKDRGYVTTEQRLCDQVRLIKSKGWLSVVELDAIRQRVLGCVGDLEVSQLDFGDQGACEESLVHDAGVVEGRLEEHVYGAVDRGLDPVPSAVREEVMELKRIWHEVMSKDKVERYDFRRVNRYRLMEETRKVNELVKFIKTSDITETNCLIRAVCVNVAKRLGLCELLEDNRAIRGESHGGIGG